MSIQKINNSWHVRTYIKINGKLKQTHKTFNSKKKAIEWERENIKSKNDILFLDLYKLYFNEFLKKNKGSTMEYKKSLFKNHLVFFKDFYFKDINKAEIKKFQFYLLDKNYKNNYLIKIQKELKNILNFADELGLNKVNFKIVTNNNHSEKINIITEEEFLNILEEINNLDYKIFLMVAFYTGARIGEIQALGKKDIFDCKISITKNLYKNILDVPKTKNSVRDITIPFFLNEMLSKYSKKKNRLFTFDVSNLRKKFKKICYKKLKKNVRLHDLRHSHATFLLNEGILINNISARLGHSTITTTLNIYGHNYDDYDYKITDIIEKKYLEHKK